MLAIKKEQDFCFYVQNFVATRLIFDNVSVIIIVTIIAMMIVVLFPHKMDPNHSKRVRTLPIKVEPKTEDNFMLMILFFIKYSVFILAK